MATFRMKRTLICLVPWMAMTTAAYGQTRSADVLYTYFNDGAVPGFRVSDECFVPVEEVAKWGWTLNTRPDSADIVAESIAFNIPLRNVSGRTVIPLRAAIAKLGGSAEWVGDTDTLQVTGELKSVSVDSGRVKVTGPMLFKTKASTLSNPPRVVIDFLGARIGSKTTQSLEGGVRLTQYKPNTVRLIIQTQGSVDVSRVSTAPTRSAEMEFSVGQPAEDPKPVEPSKPVQPEKKPRDPVTTPPTGTTPPPIPTTTVPTTTVPTTTVPTTTVPTTPPTTVTITNNTADGGIIDGSAQATTTGFLPLTLDKEDERTASLSIHFKPGVKVLAQFDKLSPTVLNITLPGVFMDLPPDFKIESASVISATSEKNGKGTVVTLTMVRPLGAEVYSEGSAVSIQLYKPSIGDGKLMNKVVVVDAGHGGWDGGASGGGLHEKDFTLSIAKLLSARLIEEGVTVIMTRKSDVYIPLMTRSNIANDNHADMFISCHINDTGGSGSMSGSITFHHKGNAISKVLAECIQQQIGAVSELPNIGVWSDGRIYSQGGFSVLRNIKMVGVLIEFGFLNNAHDRKRMSTEQFQDAVTRAVVRGLKVYLGDAKAK